MVAEHPDSDLMGAMMLSIGARVVVAMVSLALIASLILLARQLLKELMKKEKIERVVLREEEMPELFHSPYGEKTHTSRTCVGLRNASYVSRHTPCSLCCPGGLRAKEARSVEYRRTFLEAAGKYLWLKVFLIVVIMVVSWFMVFEVNHTFGFPLHDDRMVVKQEAYPKNESGMNASRHERSVTPVEEVPTGKSQEGDHVEMFTTWSQLHEPNTKRRTRTISRTTPRTRTCTTGTTRTKENKSTYNIDVVKYEKIVKNEDVPRTEYFMKVVFHKVVVFGEYLAVAGRSLEPVKSYVVRTCHPVLLLLGTPLVWSLGSTYIFGSKSNKTKIKIGGKEPQEGSHASLCVYPLPEKSAVAHGLALQSHAVCSCDGRSIAEVDRPHSTEHAADTSTCTSNCRPAGTVKHSNTASPGTSTDNGATAVSTH